MNTEKNVRREEIEILIVEDSPTQAELLRHLLEQHDYKVVAANNGKQALALIDKHKPALVISDIVMPEMDGYKLCRHIKDDSRTQNIPVILLTSLTDAEDVLNGLECGADNFITKPFDEDYLLRHVEQIITSRKICNNERVRVGIEIMFGGKRRFITADQQQMLSLLISTYEEAVRKNAELVKTQNLYKTLNERLATIVEERTATLTIEVDTRKKAEDRIRKLNRVYAMLSNINQAIVRIREPQTLFKEACRIAVEEGGLKMVWIGLADPTTGKVKPVASAGVTGSYLEKTHIAIGGEKQGNCPAGSVLMAGKHFICNDMENDPCMASWREEALKMGFRSSIVFPLKVSGRVRGVFQLYTAETGFFDEEELKLLDELVMDISFAMEFAEKEAHRRQIEEALVTSEARYRSYIDVTGQIGWVTNANGEVVEDVPSLRKFSGQTYEEAKGLGWSKAIHPDEFERTLQVWNNAVGSKSPYETEFRMRRNDGVYRYLLARGFPVFRKDGRIQEWVGTCIDITERKQVEEALKQASENWQATFDAINDSVVILNPDHEIMAINQAGLKAIGKTREEAIGQKCYRIVHGTEEPIKSCPCEKSLISHKTETSEYAQAGRTFELVACPQFDVNNRVSAFTHIVKDITERKKAEQELRESKALFEAVVENVPLMIFLKEATDLRFVIFNRAGEQLLGYDRKALLGKNNLDLFPPEQAAHFMAKDREVLDGKSGMLDFPEEPIETAKNGQRLLHTQKVCIRGEDGTTKYLLGISEDITERKQAEEKQKKLEEQLRQSQKLEAIGQLSSGVAHDFNNLLGGIIGHAELLKMGLDAGSDLMRHPETIISSCTKAADLTRQLLMFARKAPVEFQKMDLNDFIKQVVKLMGRTIDRSIEIVVDLQERPAIISGDRNQLENALLNMAINARDAMPGGGKLCITSETVNLSKDTLQNDHFEAVEGPYVKISITDTGTGMSKETKDRIFEPFFTTKEVGKGTGLGLASVYGCVKQHGGYIAVESQEGKGTTFSIYLPEAKSAGPVPEAQEEQMLIQGKGSLLVVDDEPVYHEVLNKIFSSLGYTVHCCANGPDAVAFYREHSTTIDVVILDMNMPKMNGLQCFRGLKEIKPGVRVIVASGYGDNSDRQAMLKEGVCAFVQKPYKAADLAKKIMELIGAG